jgi:hypothetical protein
MDAEELFFENETRKHQQEAAKMMLLFAQHLITRAMTHDKSKLLDPEREGFIVATPKLRDLTYGTPEYAAALKDLGPALKHHYEVNPHHPEHFGMVVDDMALFDVVEMLCDWIAAVKRHADGDIGKSITNNQGRFGISPQLSQIFRNTVTQLRLLEETL